MKKDDFKKSIDNINPDAYMGNRLKAKITTDMPVRNNRRVTVSITAFCLAFAIIFGVAFLTPPTAPTSQTTTDSAVVEKRINPFIIVASAAEVQNTEVGTENKVLDLIKKCGDGVRQISTRHLQYRCSAVQMYTASHPSP